MMCCFFFTATLWISSACLVFKRFASQKLYILTLKFTLPECCVQVSVASRLFGSSLFFKTLHIFRFNEINVWTRVFMCSVQREFYQTVRRTEAPKLRPSRTQPQRGAANTNIPLSREDTAARPLVIGVSVSTHTVLMFGFQSCIHIIYLNKSRNTKL